MFAWWRLLRLLLCSRRTRAINSIKCDGSADRSARSSTSERECSTDGSSEREYDADASSHRIAFCERLSCANRFSDRELDHSTDRFTGYERYQHTELSSDDR